MERITIGTVAKAQGIKGEIKVTILSNEKDIFKKIKKVALNGKEYTVESVKNLANGIFFKLEGINDRDSAELLRGQTITCDRRDIPKLPKGRYLISDIMDSDIVINGKICGTLTDILQNGSADVYCVTGTNGTKNFMFPCLKTVLKKVDIENKTIELDSEILEQIALYED